MVNIEIDGIPIKAENGAMIIEAADEAGIPIARFCYHKKLSVAANCRMCLVEVDKAAKPLPACATPVTEGMKVLTRSPRALDAQRGTMEFLLINHPLDCPICDQGGECELQDVSMGYGESHSRFEEGKRVVRDKDIGPLISTEMTRCIHCTRCVRFGEEIAGIKELGAVGRGEHMEIGTYVQKAVTSELSGNVIDLCPVGALTSKPFRYTARPWELISVASVAPHDCVGSNIYLHQRGNRVMRALPQENEAVNETWISDRDRFSYEGLNSADRLTAPMIKRDGEWEEVDWETALHTAVARIKGVMTAGGAKQLGMLVSPSATLEEMYLAQKWLRGLGGANIDHRLRQCDFTDQTAAPIVPSLGCTLEELETVDGLLIVGANVRKDQPIIGHRIRKASLRGARIAVINPIDYEFRFRVAERIIASPAEMERALAGVVKALLEGGAPLPPAVATLLGDVQVNDSHRGIAALLRSGKKNAIVLGNQAAAHPAAATLRALAGMIAELTEASVGTITEGANSAGAHLAGVLPHRGPAGVPIATAGLDARAMLEAKLKGYIVLGIEPELDCGDSAAALTALRDADSVIVLSSYVTPALRDYADVLLPVSPFSETSGTFVNIDGRWQSFSGAVALRGETRPAWKVLRVLGNLFQLPGFDYLSSIEVRDEVAKLAGGVQIGTRAEWPTPARLSPLSDGIVRLADVPIYAIDSIVRRSEPLQKTADAVAAAVHVNSTLAGRLALEDGLEVTVKQGITALRLPVVIDEAVADGCLWIPAGVAGSVGLGANGVAIEITRT